MEYHQQQDFHYQIQHQSSIILVRIKKPSLVQSCDFLVFFRGVSVLAGSFVVQMLVGGSLYSSSFVCLLYVFDLTLLYLYVCSLSVSL